MSRINTPATIADSPSKSQSALQGVGKMLGSVPNLFRLVGNSPSSLEGYLGLNGAMSRGELPAATRERIALAIANVNHCVYCNSAHTYLGKNIAKLSEEEMQANRQGRSTDSKADAAVRFAVAVAEKRGQVSADELAALQEAGYSDGEAVEIVVLVALNTLTNYVNEVFQTEVDFPRVELDPAGTAA